MRYFSLESIRAGGKGPHLSQIQHVCAFSGHLAHPVPLGLISVRYET